MRQMFARLPVGALVLTTIVAVLAASELAAQTTTGTIRGFVRDSEGNPVAGASVVAVDPATNFRRGTLARETGFFNIPGLPPGQYELRASSLGYGESEQPVRLLVGQTLNLEVMLLEEAIALEAVVVRAQRIAEMATPEIATNITPEQIESMPMNDRNFMSLAALAPGVTFGCQGPNCPPGDGGGLSAGGGSGDNANVFVDGVSFKNDILRGGVAGQDASKGNPFPQVAVQEFRVVTQQFKAEYQKASTAVVTATTRSGTNRWQGSLFGFRQHEGLIRPNFFTVQQCREGRAQDPNFECAPRPKLGKWQIGGSLGGPIVQDKLFFFAAYEGNHQDRAFTVTAPGLAQWPTSVQNEMRAHEGTFPSEFRSNLYFGKLTYAPSSRNRFELSGTIRDEFDIRNFGGRLSFENAEHFHNDVNTFLAKHQYSAGNLLNEAQVSYQHYRWFPIQLRTDLIGKDYQGGLKLGGRCCPQDHNQKRWSLSNDVSYTMPGRAGDHVFKVGANVDFADYDVMNALQLNPQFFFTGGNADIPERATVGFGTPNYGAKNTQLGIYAQDDWSVTPRLTLNLGVRWDYESNGLNNDYVTPPEVVAEVGSRMNELLIIDQNYFTDGNDRPAFKGGIQPRLGFSYDVTGRNETVLFGGFGLYYDRLAFSLTAGERARLLWQVFTIRFSEDGSEEGTIAWDDRFFDRDALQEVIASGTTGLPEVFLMNNNQRPPRSNHFSLGVRQLWRDLLFTLNYTGVRGHNQHTWFFANRAPDGSTFRLPSYFNVLASTDQGRTWYDALNFTVDKPFTRGSRWGGAINYTLSWTDDYFGAGRPFAGLDFRTPDDFVRRRSERDQRHNVTANAIVGLPLDVRLSGIMTLGSGRRYRVFYGGPPCNVGNRDCISNNYPAGEPTIAWGNEGVRFGSWGGTDPFTGEPETSSFLGIGGWAFRNVDLRLEREFEYGGQRVVLMAEGFNVFNYANFMNYDGRIGNLTPEGDLVVENEDFGPGNPNFGARTGVIDDTRLTGAPRRWQFGLRYAF